jgi:cytochrome c biogenesis protein CcmG/thiol:disulfide interchange protein DsbE
MQTQTTMQQKAKRRPSRRTLGTLIFFTALNIVLVAVLVNRLTAAHHIISGSAIAPLVGHPAPDFTLNTWNNPSQPTIQLSALKGKPVVMNIWASWCEPCKSEVPTFEAAWQQHQSEGIVFLGIDYNDAAADAQHFLQQYGVTYPSGPDASGTISTSYGVSNVPSTIFIDRSGTVVRKILGPVDAQTLEDEIQQLLK